MGGMYYEGKGLPTSKIDKFNKSNEKLNKLVKESDEINKKGHKTTQVSL